MTSNVVIIEKNKKQYVRLATASIPGTQGAFSDKVALDIDDFTDEPEFQCDVHVVKNTFVGDSK